MEAVILALIPGLSNYPFLLNVCSVLFAFFFGGFIFSAFWGLITGFKK